MDALTAAWNVAHDYKGPHGTGTKQLAIDIDCNPTTLAHELNGTGTAKLGLLTAIKITKRTGDLRILHAAASEVGCVLMPMPEAMNIPSGAALEDLCRMAKEFADVVQEVGSRVADGDISDNDIAAIEREWCELMAQGHGMLSRLRSMNLAQKPRHLRSAA